jgi:2-dehydro-3-deoxyphosphogluconate aldolase / (4S)-4-hydroxy-2-oxoglutarate aldolase
VIRRDDVFRSRDAGARFCVSPGLTATLASACREADIPLLSGISTASELMVGLELGFKTFKFFPAVPAGGAPTLSALRGPFPDVRFCPTGGITERTACDFLRLPNVICVGGAWVAPGDVIQAGLVGDRATRAPGSVTSTMTVRGLERLFPRAARARREPEDSRRRLERLRK